MIESQLEFLRELGIKPRRDTLFNPSEQVLSELAERREEGVVVKGGAVVSGGVGQAPSERDRFIVKDAQTEPKDWWESNQDTTPEIFSRLWDKAASHLSHRDLFVLDVRAGTDPVASVRLVTEFAWRGLLAGQTFEPIPGAGGNGAPEWTVMDAPSLKAFPLADGTNSEAYVAVDVSNRRVLILGTAHPDEIKDSILTALDRRG